MKISDNFSKLQETNALFLVSGKQAAIIYRLRNGEIHERETIEVATPEYTDWEGHYEYRGPRGKIHGWGSMREPKGEHVHQMFLGSLVKEIKQIKRPYDSIYLFAPIHVIDGIELALPKTVSKKIKRRFTGNFTKMHPTDLLAKVTARRKQRVRKATLQLVAGEAAKILRRGKRSIQGLRKKKAAA